MATRAGNIMTLDERTAGFAPVPSIDAVLAAHGAGKVLAAAVAALLRGRFRKARPPDLRRLGRHLLRDIGIETGDWTRRDPLL